ncbi:hypothetical protein [Clostridium sp. Cult3]|uniref:hypothetical protein n=1 Tax=Clostridium sp. Cult3 TaxID=2079004 RepID=UPI001F47592B|nr:hypothetical protein [Clostridium sp. Cult3]
MLAIEYCARAIIQHLNGDIKLFQSYRDKAIELYEKENSVPIEELIPAKIREKLYEMVS